MLIGYLMIQMYNSFHAVRSRNHRNETGISEMENSAHPINL